jgi:Uma2 family endonuclease
MSAEPARTKTWTAEEYLAGERSAPEKHTFFRGEVFAMAGASRQHNLLVGNVVRVLGNALLERPCETYPSDMRIKVPATGLYTYADASVTCGEPQFDDEIFDTLLNPIVIVEVLSDSTERYDRGEKFESYRTIPSFRDYLLVTQNRVLVEHFARQPDGSWLLRVHREHESVELASIGCAIAVDEIYRKARA